MSSSSATAAAFATPDQFSSTEQLCYVHCNFCDTVLAVSVPFSILFKTVKVRCGHCSNLLSVNMLTLLPTFNQPNLSHSFLNPPNLLEEARSSSPNLLINQPIPNAPLNPLPDGEVAETPKPPLVNQPPEKRQRVPSAYNRFIKDEIQRIKARNPDISHREAFSAAAKNWAHFPHVHFGVLPDQPVKMANVRPQQEGEDVLTKDGFLAAANVELPGYQLLLPESDRRSMQWSTAPSGFIPAPALLHSLCRFAEMLGFCGLKSPGPQRWAVGPPLPPVE
ncbi:hypothetical protein Nepgr_024231 [Nepenthes gracilis]|uniref:Uncharacterized protein n=1 Tax=Nepenthes gracilis TaxID=150966 RepID=A0AAD3T3L8_NEPGR|nr:hypothetical protein Nepgr_024231 [Nepenthes gracilis]